MIKNSAKIGAMFVILVILAFSVNSYIDGGNKILESVTGNTVNTGSSEASSEIASINEDGTQVVKLKVENYGYVFEPSTLNKNVKTKVIADMDTISGCLRDIRIPAFGIQKLLTEEDNTFEFTPTQSGEFRIHCSMNMGQGTFIVVEQDGTKSDFVEDSSAAANNMLAGMKGGSCGAAGGGCGCGG